MQLFKRLLLSFFPSNIAEHQINPASIFISFITSKEYFSVINRKIVENYKLNLFDVALDPFEFKIGFGNNPNTQIKDVDSYYSYCASANINGTRLYNLSNTANAMAIATSIMMAPSFKDYKPTVFVNFIFTIYLFSYVMMSKMKVFPHKNEQDNFNRFIELFFAFYEIVLIQTGSNLEGLSIQKIKTQLLQHNDRRHILIEYYQSYNNIFETSLGSHEDFLTRLYQDQYKDESSKTIIQDYIQNAKYHVQQSSFSLVEKKLLPYILPADILLRHIFIETDPIQIVQSILGKVYPHTKLQEIANAIRIGDKSIIDLLTYLTDYKHLKNNFFQGIKKYTQKILNQHTSIEEQEEIDDFMSSIGSIDSINTNQIPEKIRKESKLMEKLVNFYITYIGGLRIARGETFYCKLSKPHIIKELSHSYQLTNKKSHTLHQYGSMLYSYSKNAFYYKYAANNIRAGREKFYLPFKSTLKRAESNIYVVQLLNEIAIASILQDSNIKDIKLYINNQAIIDEFKQVFAHKISLYAGMTDKKFLEKIYSPIDACLETLKITPLIQKYYTTHDIRHTKENLYTLDFRLFQSALTKIATKCKDLQEDYADMNILVTLSLLKETILGILLYIHYLNNSSTSMKQKKSARSNHTHIELLYQLYITDILHLHEKHIDGCTTVLKQLLIEYEPFFNKRIALDDNNSFINIAASNRSQFTFKKDTETILNDIIGEDIMRFRGFLKNISYYNKRFIIPK